jgi:NitT/TauT family transport system ATP-binding protein
MVPIELTQLAKRYGSGRRATDAVAPLDLRIEAGQLVAVLGPSGCGKTTLLRMLAGLTVPSSGEVVIGGEPLWRAGRPNPAATAKVAMAFQEATLLPWASIEDNVALGLRFQKVGRDERRQRARDLCELTGIGTFTKHRPHELSIGMRQRAALARALTVEPDVLLLDEPFAALDAITRDAMNLELQRVWLARPCTVVLVTHSIHEAAFLADRVVSLTTRPARVAEIVDVPFARPRPPLLEHEPEFQALVRDLRRSLGAVA